MIRYLICCVLCILVLASCGVLPEASTPAVTQTAVGEAAYPDPGTTAEAQPTAIVEPQTPDPDAVEAGATPTVTSPPTEAPTLTPTMLSPTLTPTSTPTTELAQKPTATPYLLSVQIGAPIYTANFAHPEFGCDWLGVAGQVFDVDGAPVENLVVEAGGLLGPSSIMSLAMTGSATNYGPGGFEIKLADVPVETQNTVWIQIRDLGGEPLSGPTYFRTYDDCDKNLVMINFTEIPPPAYNYYYLPLIDNNR